MDSKTEGKFEAYRKAFLAGFLTWLIPGLGHLFLGKKVRAIVFFIIVHCSLTLGLACDGRFFLVDKRQPIMSYLQTITNLAAGPLDIVGRMYVYGYPAYFLPAFEEPGDDSLLVKMRERMESSISAYGTAYLLTAGLMNMLLILDVFDISVRRKE